MTRFTFITNIKGHDPEARVAEIMRQAAMVIERQVPLAHHHMYDVFGDQLCEWEIEEVEEDAPISARTSPPARLAGGR